jgi:hypothetical protein
MNLFVGSCSWYICYDRFGFITCNTRQVSFMKQENLTLSEHMIALSAFVGFRIVRVFVLFCFILYVYPPGRENNVYIYPSTIVMCLPPGRENNVYIYPSTIVMCLPPGRENNVYIYPSTIVMCLPPGRENNVYIYHSTIIICIQLWNQSISTVWYFVFFNLFDQCSIRLNFSIL